MKAFMISNYFNGHKIFMFTISVYYSMDSKNRSFFVKTDFFLFITKIASKFIRINAYLFD